MLTAEFVIQIFYSFIIGAIFGSFASCIGWRLFNKSASIFGTRSVCCSCKKTLLIRDMIPIFSFLKLKGRCRFCGSKIPIWHFLAEVILSICFVASTIIFHGINIQTALLWAISTMLVIQSISDIRTMMSSDILSLSIFAKSLIHLHISSIL